MSNIYRALIACDHLSKSVGKVLHREDYSAVKRNEALTQAATRMTLQDWFSAVLELDTIARERQYYN